MSPESAANPYPLHPSQSDMAEALPQIVWTARPDGTVDWVNQEFESYTGISDADLASGDWLLALHPDDRDPTLKVWETAISRALRYRTEFRIWCAAEERWRRHLVDARPHLDAAGRITRWYGIAIDVQDLHDAEEVRDAELRLQIVERRVLEQIAAGDALPRILKDICTAMADVVKGTHITVSLLSDDGRDPDPGPATREEWSQDAGPTPGGEGQGAGSTLPFRREPASSADTPSDPLRKAYSEAAARWSLPILDAAGRPIARFACHHDAPLAPTSAQIALLQRMAEFVRIAILQVQSRDRLQASEQRYRSLFDFLPIGIWDEDISGILTMLGMLKADGVTDFECWLYQNPTFVNDAVAALRVLDANRAARQLHGLKDGGPETLSTAVRGLAGDPRFRAAMRGMLVALWEGRTNHATTYSVPRPDGTRADVMVRMLLPEPGSGRLLVTELDVTEQRRAEERFRHVAQASSDYIFDRDFASETTWVNDAASWIPDHPAGPCEIPRDAWVNSVHPDDSDEILRQIVAAVDGGEDFWEGEYRLRQRDGEYIPVLERASILRNDTGEPVRMIGNIIDLSEQKALEAQLRQSQRLDAVGQLTGGIAHDFNNLLTVILGNAEVLADTLPADQPIATMARHIMIASERAAELTQRLLAFARKQPLQPGEFDTNAIIEDMRMLVERSITPAITLDLQLAENLGAVHVDRAMFESALLNLCVNARDAMPEGGSLRITTCAICLPASADHDAPQAGEYIRVAVSDTGEGMDGDTLARVFEPFFTTKPVGAGSGLGLSMVHGFVHQSGGHVRIRSELGKGTTVELLLPRHDPSTDAQDEPEAAPPAPRSATRGRILLVEDEERVRDYMCMIVRSLGYEVQAVPGAAPALDRLRAGEPFDLLLSDVVMPGGMSGRQLADTVLMERQGLPVLLVSGHAEEIAAADRQFDPRIGFLRKPFRKIDLEHRLADMLSG